MAEKDKQLEKLVQEAIEKEIGGMIKLLGYMEHQLDLSILSHAYLLKRIPEEEKDDYTRMIEQHINDIAELSSVDFDNLDSPLENYKLPKLKESKAVLRKLQPRYVYLSLKEKGEL